MGKMELSNTTIKYYMLYCIELANNPYDSISKPHVGSLIVSKEAKILGEGYRKIIKGTKDITLHAERSAILNALDNLNNVSNSIMFTTLEPCIDSNKRNIFESCCDMIIKHGLETVVVGLRDTSLKVRANAGINYLRSNGINVILYEDLKDLILMRLMDVGYRRND